jgi:hypothetical protein
MLFTTHVCTTSHMHVFDGAQWCLRALISYIHSVGMPGALLCNLIACGCRVTLLPVLACMLGAAQLHLRCA